MLKAEAGDGVRSFVMAAVDVSEGGPTGSYPCFVLERAYSILTHVGCR